MESYNGRDVIFQVSFWYFGILVFRRSKLSHLHISCFLAEPYQDIRYPKNCSTWEYNRFVELAPLVPTFGWQTCMVLWSPIFPTYPVYTTTLLSSQWGIFPPLTEKLFHVSLIHDLYLDIEKKASILWHFSLKWRSTFCFTFRISENKPVFCIIWTTWSSGIIIRTSLKLIFSEI